MESFVSNENKSVLWGVLQDNKIKFLYKIKYF